VDRNDASALADLQMHWDEAYVIGVDGGVWSARFRTSTDELQARTSTDLRELIRADYIQRQRPRPAAGPAAGTDSARPAEPLDAGQGEDRGSPPASDRNHGSFAGIRGERMST